MEGAEDAVYPMWEPSAALCSLFPKILNTQSDDGTNCKPTWPAKVRNSGDQNQTFGFT